MDGPTQELSLPLKCFTCRTELAPAFSGGGVDGDTHQPSAALMFTAYGNYGSTIYDPGGMGGHECLMINICDSCVSGGAIDGVVVYAVRTPRPTDTTYTLWTPPGVSRDDDGE
jgi:hypothetical protein